MILENEIEAPQEPSTLPNSLAVALGPPVPKLKRLEILESDAWEDIVNEIVHYHWKKQYRRVVRCGGAGDMGRDVIAYKDDGTWINYQCKYYKGRKLTLADALLEIGKLAYYSHTKQYVAPKEYYFVAPVGVSSQLLQHLMNEDMLKSELFKRWDKSCKSKITQKEDIDLDDALREHIENLDFKIFDHLAPLDIIDLHSKTPYHAARFGDERKERPTPSAPPPSPTTEELGYTTELLRAFSDKEKSDVKFDDLENYSNYQREYTSARKNYYYAEGLEKFSRDWLTDKTFTDLLDECYEAISPIVMMDHSDGLERYLKTSIQATTTNFDQHPLHHHITIKDKKGMCHHLVNNGAIKWVKETT